MIAAVSLMPVRRSSTVASIRLTRYLADQLGARVIDNAGACHVRAYDAVLLVNGPGLYCDFRPELTALCQANQRFFYITNDYTLPLMSQLRFITERDYTRVANFENYDAAPRHVYINWNMLTFLPNRPVPAKTRTGLFYYGAYRQDREPSFRKWFVNAPYPVHISAPSAQALAKYLGMNPGIVPYTGLNILAHAGNFTDTLYIEDEANHAFYHSPANRWYECLSAGVCIHIDAACAHTFERAELDVRRFLVSDPAELAGRLGDTGLLERQRLAFYNGRDYRRDLDREVATCLKPLL